MLAPVFTCKAPQHGLTLGDTSWDYTGSSLPLATGQP
jgi:hypothetical protein